MWIWVFFFSVCVRRRDQETASAQQAQGEENGQNLYRKSEWAGDKGRRGLLSEGTGRWRQTHTPERQREQLSQE